jgi:hypothetical protein
LDDLAHSVEDPPATSHQDNLNRLLLPGPQRATADG